LLYYIDADLFSPTQVPMNKNKPFKEHQLLSTTEIARILGVSTKSVRDYSHCGLIPYIRLGKRLLKYRRRDVEKAITRMNGGSHNCGSRGSR
jgi:excisionase family DNA binding protein